VFKTNALPTKTQEDKATLKTNN